MINPYITKVSTSFKTFTCEEKKIRHVNHFFIVNSERVTVLKVLNIRITDCDSHLFAFNRRFLVTSYKTLNCESCIVLMKLMVRKMLLNKVCC